ncbi:MAG: putative membrane protein, partial [Flavobacteriales bacterium]
MQIYQLKTPWNKFRNYLTDFCDMNDDSSLYAVPLRMISGWILYN